MVRARAGGAAQPRAAAGLQMAPVLWGQRKAAGVVSSVHLFAGLVSEGLPL